MKTLLALITLAIVFATVACSKDKLETKPRIKITEYSSKELMEGEILTIKLNYYDKEGDVGLAQMMSRKIRLNNSPPIPPGSYKSDSLDGYLPDFPDKSSGEISFRLDYNTLDESQVQNDTIQFRFALTDRAGNTSDTILSDVIVIREP